MKSIAQIRTAKTADLVAFYNENSAKAVNKFTNRETAERRCTELAKAMGLPEFTEEEIAAMSDEQKAEAGIIIEASKQEEAEAESAGNAAFAAFFGMTPAQRDVVDNGTGTVVIDGKVKTEEEIVKEVKAPTGRAPNSAGVAASWKIPEVHNARLTRHGVAVSVSDSTEFTIEPSQREFKSTSDAFRALRLPVSKHIRFRMKLKAEGTQTFEMDGKFYHFELREISAPEKVEAATDATVEEHRDNRNRRDRRDRRQDTAE